MKRWVVVVALWMGCGSAKVVDAPGDTRELIGVRLDVTGPAPTESALEGWLVYEGFPAISEDGKWVAIVVPEADGARGYANLHAYLHSTDGKVTDHITILDAEDGPRVEGEGEGGPEEQGPALERTMAALHEVRARLARHTWRPLTLLEGTVADYEEAMSQPWLTADGALVVHYAEPTVYVDRAGGSGVFMRDVASLSAPEYDVCEEAARANRAPGEELDDDDKCPCSNPAVTNQVWTDASTEVVVVRVSYQGTDMCWEPAHTWFTFTVPSAPGKTWKRLPRRPEHFGLSEIWAALEVEPDALPGDTGHDYATTFHRHWASRFPNAPEVKAAARVMANTR